MDFTSATRCVEQSIKALNNSVFARKGLPAVGRRRDLPAEVGAKKLWSASRLLFLASEVLDFRRGGFFSSRKDAKPQRNSSQFFAPSLLCSLPRRIAGPPRRIFSFFFSQRCRAAKKSLVSCLLPA